MLLLITIAVCNVRSVSAHPKGIFSFGFSLDLTWKVFNLVENVTIDDKTTGISTGLQATTGCFYRQDWWMAGLSIGHGFENYYDADNITRHAMHSIANSYIAELTLAGFRRIGRSFSLTGGIIPSLHLQDGDKRPKSPFTLSPYIGLSFYPARHFTMEGRLGYDPVFHQKRLGLSFRF